MAFKCADRIKETTTTEGTGAIQLAGAVVGFKAFSSYLVNNDTTYYSIEDTLGNWENGYGTYQTGTPDSIVRTNVVSSSNNNLIVNFGSGDKNIFCTNPADATGLYAIDGSETFYTQAIVFGNNSSLNYTQHGLSSLSGMATDGTIRLLATQRIQWGSVSANQNWITRIGNIFDDGFEFNCGSQTYTFNASNNEINFDASDITTTANLTAANATLQKDGPTLFLYDTDTALSDGETSAQITFKTNDTSNPNSDAARIYTKGSGTTGTVDLVFQTGTVGAIADVLVLEATGTADFLSNNIITTGNIACGAQASLDVELNVNKANYGGTYSASAGTVAAFENNGSCVLQLLSPAANSCNIYFGDPGANNAGRIAYNHSGTPAMQFYQETALWLSYNGTTADFQANDITTTGNITGAGNIRAGNNTLTVDNQFYMGASGADTPAIFFATGGSNDYIDFIRSSNQYRWQIADTVEMTLNASTLDLQSNNITTTGEISGAHVNLKATTVAGLPAAASNTGDMYRVTDANAPSMGATVSGGGSANAMVWSNGTNWTVFGI